MHRTQRWKCVSWRLEAASGTTPPPRVETAKEGDFKGLATAQAHTMSVNYGNGKQYLVIAAGGYVLVALPQPLRLTSSGSSAVATTTSVRQPLYLTQNMWILGEVKS